MASIFTEDAGRFLSSSEAKSMTGAYRDRKLAVGLSADDYVRSEYFGINQVKELLAQPGCIGLRIHQAKRWEDADGNPTQAGVGQLKPRVLLTAVDANGHDIAMKSHSRGLKDMPGDDDGGTLGDGWTCPRQCASNQ
ncbi:hypothetical protein WBJ53_29590 [Spirosoma sp. SC4-14]|uniref:hypothetical protein n=1 Tax=Spirosoma sp. SC4-14 TaxID=3128900 RepID=UPI0030CECDE1